MGDNYPTFYVTDYIAHKKIQTGVYCPRIGEDRKWKEEC